MPATYTSRLEGLTTSVAVKAPVRVATNAAISLVGIQTIDGVALSQGDRVLVKDQANPVENGIWLANSGEWERALDFDGTLDAVGGTQVYVVEGAANEGSLWRVDGWGAKQIGVGAISFNAAFVNPGLIQTLAAYDPAGDGVTDDRAAFVAAVADILAHGGGWLIVPPGTYYLSSSVEIPSGIHIMGAGRWVSTILMGGLTAFTVNADAFVLDDNEFSLWAEKIAVTDLGFERASFSASAIAVAAYNVRGIEFARCYCLRTGGLKVQHGAQLTGRYNRNNGSTSVDPAVVAGFSATDPTLDSDGNPALNTGILFNDNFVDGTQHFVQGLRADFFDGLECVGNYLRWSNISWWGGGAPNTDGGQLTMLRRARNLTIANSYAHGGNGGIYGNNGDGITVTGCTVEDIFDVGIDMEGCFNWTVTGCLARNCGNAGFSVFYASLQGSISNCVSIQDGKARNSLIDGTTSNSFTSNVTVSSVADNGSGLMRITLSAARDLVTGQRVRISGGNAAGTWTLTRIDGSTYDLQGSAYAGSTGGTLFYQLGNSPLWFRTSGFSSNGSRGVELSIQGNYWAWTAEEGLGATSPGNLGVVVYKDNRHYNTRVDFQPVGGPGIGGSQEMTGNILQFTNAGLGASTLLAAGGAASQGLWQRFANNTIIVQAAQPAGSIGFYLYARSNGSMLDIDGNALLNSSGTPLDYDLSLGNEEPVGALANRVRFRVRDNILGSIADFSAPGRSTAEYSNNRTQALGQTIAVGTAGAPTLPHAGGYLVGTKLAFSSLSASSTEGLVVLNTGYHGATQWAVSTEYDAGDVAWNDDSSVYRIYRCTVGGTSAGSGGPTGTGSSITDGTVTWAYVENVARFAPYGSTGVAI